jgi:hypothetical protein
MPWSLTLDAGMQGNELKVLKNMRFTDKEKMYVIYRDIVSKFNSYAIKFDDLEKRPEFIRLETCQIAEQGDPKNLAADFSDEYYFDVSCKEQIANYFEEHRANL